MKSYRRERVAELKDNIRSKHEEAGKLVRDSAQRQAPERTSLLKNSIRMHSDESGFIVGTSLYYAKFNEFGTGIYFKKGTPPDVNSPEGTGRTTPWTYYDKSLGEFRTTVGMEPRPFLWPAIKNNTSRLQAIYRKPMTQASRAKGTIL